MNSTRPDEEPFEAVERRGMEGSAMLSGPDAPSGPGLNAPRSAKLASIVPLAIIIIFWITYFLIVSMMRAMRPPGEELFFLIPRAIVCAAGVLISLSLLSFQRALRGRTLRLRALTALMLVFVGAGVHGALNQFVFGLFVGLPQPTDDPIFYLMVFFGPFWVYAALSAVILALTYSEDIREREERIGELKALASAAQLRALRHQLNPHFLFNTLNSITSLISRNSNRKAELMTESLAEFLRETLTLDPHKRITLGEELELQQLYLGIEEIRFPDRLKIRIQIPEALRPALIPSLITQPLIENSIKYAVARSSEPVELEVSARESDGRLELIVQDDGGNAEAAPARGARVGLANVAERLRVHYEGNAALSSGPRESGGYRNVISLPLQIEP
jgi:two-component system, LytTR family, sensor kinase